MRKVNMKKALALVLAAAMSVGSLSQFPAAEVKAASGSLTSVVSAEADDNIVMVTFNDGVQAKITFLEDDIFRYNVDPNGEFSEYGREQNGAATAKIVQYPDDYKAYSHPDATVDNTGDYLVISSGNTEIKFEKATAKMTVSYGDKVVMEESEALSLEAATTQKLVQHESENFYGGGTQNGRFVHTGKTINIANESNWVDGGVASPSPFYYSTEGYGVLRNTFKPGKYHFGSQEEGVVATVHNEKEFDAYFFLSDGANSAEVTQDILQNYFHVTGNPVLLPEYAFYMGHLNAYNRDSWTDIQGTGSTGGWLVKGSSSATQPDDEPIVHHFREAGMSGGYVLTDGMQAESLNGDGYEVLTHTGDHYPNITMPHKFSARGVIDEYVKYDMPLGYFLPNDGYGSGYGKNGYYMTGGVNEDGSSTAERLAAVQANVENLAEFTKYARERGVEVGLWTQSNLSPDSNINTAWHLLRDFESEVKIGGVTTLKTDVAWVGHGYNFAINGLKNAYDIVTTGVNYRPNIITVDGWAGTQRYSGVWTGDQYGGNWEYIRFHVPTFIGQSLAGNPNVSSDTDGIFGGSPLISTRDTQWKAFATTTLNMDGWGSYMKTPQTHGDPYTGIARMYMKTKAQLMPYLYTNAAAAANLETGNDDAGIPIVRAMFLEFPEDAYSNSPAMMYQYMLGENLLVAPIYTETENITGLGDDVRNGIYLPDEDQIWIDYWTGDQYRGGTVVNNFEVPIWKLPVFVKNGAIIPMWEENNSPALVDRANRQVEFWPAGSTEFTTYEDDGTYVENEQEQIDGYGTVNNISYGDHVSTKYTSVVEGTKATLTAGKATGNYDGYEAEKNTSFIVNVSKEPTSVVAKNGNTTLTKVEADSKEAVLNAEVEAGTFVYYYDESPAIETYALEAEDEFIAMMKDQVSSPKLYVKFAAADATTTAQTLVLEGFENVDADLPGNAYVEELGVPANVVDNEDAKTPTSNTISWDAVDGAISYDVEADGVVYNVGNNTSFIHTDQPYNSLHTYRVRARNAEGYSGWSELFEAATQKDPWRNVPKTDITWNGGDSWGKLAYATDHDTETMFHSTGDVVSGQEPFIMDMGSAYMLDKFEYYPRSNFSNGTVKQMDVYLSMDGVHWNLVHEGKDNTWSYDTSLTSAENVKTVDLTGQKARYVKLIVKNSVGGFFAANELAIYKVDGSAGFAVGSTTLQPTVTEGDYTNMKNYLGTSPKDESDFIDQIKQRGGDINNNEIYDVYDYTFTMFNLDGGTKKSGRVGGSASFEVSKTEVEAGETFTITVLADRVSNLNAFGDVFYFDPAVLEFVSIEKGALAGDMEDLNKVKAYDDGTAYVNLAYANRGDKALVKGSGALATITMKARTAATVADAIDLDSIMLIGPDYSLITVETGGEIEPAPIVTEYGLADVTITMTNDELTTDDGTNVTKLIQQGSYDGLFNGTQGRDFEFLWDVESNYVDGALPAHVTLPVTMHIAFNEPSELTQVTVFNANKANGYATKAEAVLNYSDGTTSEKIAITLADKVDYAPFDFIWEDVDKTVDSVDVTILEATKYGNETVKNMLTLAEIELIYTEVPRLPAEDIVYGQSDVTVTMTNDELPTDDGSNVRTLIQQGSYNGLFDGTQGRDFEFLWDYAGNWDAEGKLPAYVTLPVTMHLTLNEAVKLNQVTVYNANKANGFITKAEAVINYADGTTGPKLVIELGEADRVDYAPFDFVWEANGKEVASVDVTLVSACTKAGDVVTNMLTLAELEMKYSETATPTPLPEPDEPDVPVIPDDEVCKIFTDVAHGVWYEGAVQYVYDADIMVGDNGAFSPDLDTTRAMVAMILYRLEGSPEVTDYTKYNQFTDVAADAWYADAVAWALNVGLATGDDYNMLYNPNAAVTREQLATFLYRYTAYTGADVTVEGEAADLFGDTYVSEWAAEGFAWAIENEIIKGAEVTDDAGNTYLALNPQGTATRAQLATVLERVLN